MALDKIGTRDNRDFFVGVPGPPSVKRYTAPTPDPTVYTPTPVQTPSVGQNLSSGGLLGFDQFSANRTGNVDEAAIRETTRKNMQASIDATNSYYVDLIQNQGDTGQAGGARLDKVRAINVNSGLGGSNFATSSDLEQRGLNKEAQKGLENERNMKVQEVYGKIDEIARGEIAAKKAEALGNADAYTKYLADSNTKAQDAIKQAGQSGITATQLKETDPQRYEYLKKATGLSDFELQQQLVKEAKGQLKSDLKIVGDTAYLSTYNPLTGKVETDIQQFDVPDGSLIAFGDKIFRKAIDPLTGETVYKEALPKEKVLPESAKEFEYLTSLSPDEQAAYKGYQTEDANRKRSISVTNNTTNGLTPNQINSTVNQIAGQFDNEPVVKQFNVINEGYQFAKSIANNTNNPADDQALIYSFAKAMDPGSVVREGEYATVQKYSQSWVKSFGKSVEQALNGTGFLSSEARANIKKTIETKYSASKKNYDNVANEYQRQVQDAQSGKPRQITDYGQAYDTPENTNSNDPMGLGL